MRLWSEASPQAKAVYHLRLGGLEYPEIAERLNITEDEAIVLYRDRITKAAKYLNGDERRYIAATELARLDALQESYWAPALQGELDAAKYVLELVKTRMKLFNLDQPDKDGAAATRVLIVGGTQQEFIEALSIGRSQYMASTDGEDGSDPKEAS